MTDRPKRRPVSAAVGKKMRQIEERLVQLEDQLHLVRSQGTRSAGAARARLAQIEKGLATRLARAQTTLKTSLDRASGALSGSRQNVEREVSALVRGLKAGARASREAYRTRRRG